MKWQEIGNRQWREFGKRPRGISIICALLVFAGFGYLISSTSAYLSPGAPILFLGIENWEAQALLLYGFVLNGLAVFYLFSAYGLVVGKGWAWTFTIIGQIVGVPLFFFYSLFANTMGLGVESMAGSIAYALGSTMWVAAIGVVIILYLSRPKTRAYFGKVKLEE